MGSLDHTIEIAFRGDFYGVEYNILWCSDIYREMRIENIN